MELRYKLQENRYERESPDKNLKINEVLFLKYFESEVDQRMKKFDNLVAASKFPLKIIEKILIIIIISFYLLSALVLLNYSSSVDYSSNFSLAHLAKMSGLEKLSMMFNNSQGQNDKNLNLYCNMTGITNSSIIICEKNDLTQGNITNLNETLENKLVSNENNTKTSLKNEIIQNEIVVNNKNCPDFDKIKLVYNENVYSLKEKWFFSKPSMFLRLNLIFILLTFLSTIILSYVLKHIRSKVDQTLNCNIEKLLKEESSSSDMFQFYLFVNFEAIRVKINNCDIKNSELSHLKVTKHSPMPISKQKENIECVNRTGYQLLGKEEEN